MTDAYLGIDVGSVSTNFALISKDRKPLYTLYIRTKGNPIKAIKKGLKRAKQEMPKNLTIKGCGATGSGRFLASAMVGADVIKTEIMAHAIATMELIPDVATILEIGGQDSKVIVVRDKVVVDFAMNSVCAAGTGSFLDHQATRLGLPIEEFGDYALRAKSRINIAGRCTVFAESDMIHKQQTGQTKEDIIMGLSDALVRNFLNNICKGKDINPPVVFQGGVAANKGIVKAFEDMLELKVKVPSEHGVMGAIGMGLLAQEEILRSGKSTSFRGFESSDFEFSTSSFECKGCENLCEVVQMFMNKKIITRWGGRCGKWEDLKTKA